MPDEYDHVVLGDVTQGTHRTYRIVAGTREKYANCLKEQFPADHAAIDKFVSLTKKATNSAVAYVILKIVPMWLARLLIFSRVLNVLTCFFTLATRSLADVLAEVTDNEELRAVLAYNFGDYGTLPKDTSFVMHAQLIAHFLYGVSYPRGGASEIAFHLIPVIEKTGGRVLVRGNVAFIILDSNGTAVGVQVAKSGGEVDVIRAPLVISDAGLFNTYEKLLPKSAQQLPAIQHALSLGRHGMGAMSVFIGLNGSEEELHLPKHQTWLYESGTDLDADASAYFSKSLDEVLREETISPMLFISFPSTKVHHFIQCKNNQTRSIMQDRSWSERFPGKSTCTLILVANWEWFAQWKDERVKKRGDDYEQVKNTLAAKARTQLLKLFPHLEERIDYFEAGSPLTNNYYIAAPKGEIYGVHHCRHIMQHTLIAMTGLDHNKERFSPEAAATLRPDTPIAGLLMTGQDVFSAGFAGALFGGLFCASSALKRPQLYFDLQRVCHETKAKQS